MNSKKNRLLHLIKSLELGGIEKSTILYSNYLHEKMDFVGIYASKGFYDDSNFINNQIKRFLPPHPIWQKRFFTKNLFNLLAIIKNNEISQLHYHHRIFIPFVFIIKIIYPKIEIIYTHHNVFNDAFNNLIIGDKFVALNETTKQDLPQKLHKRVVIIPHGVKIIQKLREFKSPPKNIGYVGRFTQNKGIINLINSFSIISNKIHNTKLVLVGQGTLIKKIRRKIDDLELKRKVILKSPSFSENEIYSDIDILVLPSEKLEGFGLVVLEAFANGIPVVVADLQIYDNFVMHNYNGFIVKENLSETILKMLNSSEYYNELSKNAFLTANKYDINRITSEYINLYLDLI